MLLQATADLGRLLCTGLCQPSVWLHPSGQRNSHTVIFREAAFGVVCLHIRDGCARERGSASMVPASGPCSCRAQLQRGCARGRAPASPGSLSQLLAPAMTPSGDRSLPSTAARPEPEGFPALGAGRWSLGICQAPSQSSAPLALLCHALTGFSWKSVPESSSTIRRLELELKMQK